MVKKNNLRKIFASFVCLACAVTCAAAFAACDGPEKEDDNAAAKALASGTYWAEHETTSMGGLTYVVHFTLDAEKNTYYFSSYYAMDNQWAHATYVVNESGTYTDDGTNVVFKSEGKNDITATVSENSFTLAKDVAGMNMSAPELTYEKGSAPIYVTYYVDGSEYNKVGYKNASDSVVPLAEPDEKEGFTFAWGTVPETAGSGASVYGTFTAETGVKDELNSGDYSVDISWSPMASRFDPVLIIDAENKTFDIWNGEDRETNKGTGTITFNDGVYTLNYDSGKTTTFTYDSEEITFTSALCYGAATFNRLDDDEETFVPYTAQLTENN